MTRKCLLHFVVNSNTKITCFCSSNNGKPRIWNFCRLKFRQRSEIQFNKSEENYMFDPAEDSTKNITAKMRSLMSIIPDVERYCSSLLLFPEWPNLRYETEHKTVIEATEWSETRNWTKWNWLAGYWYGINTLWRPWIIYLVESESATIVPPSCALCIINPKLKFKKKLPRWLIWKS